MSTPNPSVLREMGLAPIWRLRSRTASAGQGRGDESLPTFATPPQPAAEAPPLGAGAPRQPVPRPVDRQPVARPPAAAEPPPRPEASAAGTPGEEGGPLRTARIAALDWDALEADIRACTACRLCESRKQAVPGTGDRDADWMFVGEAPGAEEDRVGEPFVGAAGKLLDAMLAAIGLKRGEGVYIANALKCRPPLNRTPQADEIAACRPYLERQLALIGPRLIVALGRPAAQSLLETDVRINAARGQRFRVRETPLVVTYHPAYLLRNQADKAKAWEDLCFAKTVIGEP